jgi:hypothetical protein
MDNQTLEIWQTVGFIVALLISTYQIERAGLGLIAWSFAYALNLLWVLPVAHYALGSYG